jgi:L-fucose isomerase-like protein
LDLAINIYDIHKNKEEAEKFKQDNINKICTALTNVQSNRWVLMGPYTKNMQRVDFHNKHNEILKSMLDKQAEDEALREDIVNEGGKDI